jgi:glycosyltransferase involved in cell wall biosynthesis
MDLRIVIPALNEEQSIKSIIERCIIAKDYIIKNSDATGVNITVVSDGSTDNTVSYAQEYKDKISLIIFPENKGYGAAIKQGWEECEDDLLGFLDADGTCDPNFFADLINLISIDKADIALGCRLNKNSRMPLTRRIGNTIFSMMLSFFASQKVKDTASGMRVVKREILDDIYPLPDGLHFTPAMSAKAVSNPDIKILEKDMTYNEREGESKLSVLKDGIRFFNSITKLSFMYRPQVILMSLGYLFVVLSVLLMINPVLFYIKTRIVEDFMIYRFGFAGLGSIIATLLFSISYISEKVIRVSILKDHTKVSNNSIVARFFNSNVFLSLVVIFLLLGGFSLIFNSLSDRLTTGHTSEHWSRYFVMIFCYVNAFILLGTKLVDITLKLIIERKDYLVGKKIS